MPSANDALQAALSRYSKTIQDAFLTAVYNARVAIDFAELERRLHAGDVDGAARMLSITDAHLWPLQEALRAVFVDAAQQVAAPRIARGVWLFNGRNPRAEAWIADNAGTLIQGISTDSLEASRTAISDGLSSGRGLRSVALDLTGRIDREAGARTGGIVGLTTQQKEYAKNARAELGAMDEAYFDRALRDKRFDRLVRKSIDSGKPLPQADIDRIVASYRDKMLAYRGNVIAKNEAFTAQAAARHEAYLQMAEDPRFERVTKRWQHNLSAEPRPEHVMMNGTTIDVKAAFTFPDGVQMQYPHDPNGVQTKKLDDPNALARHIINCRCIAVYRAIPRV